jgi:hypothetical protein
MKHSPQSHDLDGKFIYRGPHVQRVTVAGVDLVFVPGSEHENLPSDEYLHCLVALGHLEKVAKSKKAAGPEQSQTKPL